MIVKFLARRGPKVNGRNSTAMVRMDDGSKQKVPIESVPKELLPKKEPRTGERHSPGKDWWRLGFDSDWD